MPSLLSSSLPAAPITKIEFGKYKGLPLHSLPHEYLLWMANKLHGSFWANLAQQVLHERIIRLPNNPSLEIVAQKQKKSVSRNVATSQTSVNDCPSAAAITKEKVDQWKEALDWLDKRGSYPNPDTYASLLRQIAEAKALQEGKRLHDHILRSRFAGDRLLGNLLVRMYGKCGSVVEARTAFENIRQPNIFSWNIMIAAYAENGHLEDARSVFDKVPQRNVVSWNTIIAAHVENGHGKEALELFRRMDVECMKPNKITFTCVLDACASLGSLAQGKGIHAAVVDHGFESDVIVATALVKMYGKCGSLNDARCLFDKMPQGNVVSWNAMIAAHAQNGHGKKALELFRRMNLEGVKPDKITFICALDACASLGALAQGKEIHTSIVDGRFESDVVVGTALVTMYGKCGSLDDARSVFDKMPQRNVVSWNAMIAAYGQNEQGEEALKLFRRISLDGVNPNKITFISVLDACASLGTLQQGKEIHAIIVNSGFESDVAVGTALVNMYGKCGRLNDARSLFDQITRRSVFSWNTMIAAYAQNGHGKIALELFQQMDLEGVNPDKITFLCVLDACAGLAALAQGKGIHSVVLTHGFESDVVVGTALIKMYGKCGSSNDARKVFDKMSEHDLVSWNAMITAYAQNGHAKQALDCFQEMNLKGANPNKITFISILSACSHTGLLDDGWQYFVSMGKDYGITPAVEHYRCMLDLIGRAGNLDEAEDFINNLPFEPDAVAFMTLLGACRIYGDVERGACAAEHAFKLDTNNAAPYILLSNIYASAGRQDDVTNVRKTMQSRGIKKIPGHSYIEIRDRMHRFVAGDMSHPQKEEIYAELQKLSRQLKETGYTPDTKVVLHDVEEEEKEYMLCYHSEKLAIAFGLISTAAGAPLHIIKNLRVCSDCHMATNLISKIVGRKIIVRDASRFHHFEQGVCSCGDYW